MTLKGPDLILIILTAQINSEQPLELMTGQMALVLLRWRLRSDESDIDRGGISVEQGRQQRQWMPEQTGKVGLEKREDFGLGPRGGDNVRGIWVFFCIKTKF